MMNRLYQTLRCCYCIVLLLLANLHVFSQLRADFTVDQAGGCSPLTVQFTNTTTGASANVTYAWDFGNGKVSSLVSPASTYFDEKTYTVTLTATDGALQSAKTMNITVYKKPVVSFSASPVKGCLPLDVTFTSTSTAGDGSIAKYFWDFGDGTTKEVTSSPYTHTYTFAQTPSVSLTVTNSYGCFNTLQTSKIVEVYGSINAAFSADKTTLCAVNETVTFTNKSTGPGTLTYQWDFGDGSSSTAKNPSHTYTQKGTYTVKLTVKSSDGCTDEIVQSDYINVANYTVDFDVPAPLCANTTASFTDKSTSGSAYGTWQVDNGNSTIDYDTTFSYVFAKAGSHTVKLTETYGSCKASTTKTVAVKASPDQKGFEGTYDNLCGVPVTIQFKDTTAGASKWLWNFDAPSGPTSTLQAPSYTYNTEGYYAVMLTVSNADGCNAYTTQYYNISKPNVNIGITASTSPTVNSGCPGFNVTFGASITATDKITSFKWDFGDGSTSTSASPQHTFNQVGTFSVKLTYTTKNGCQGEAYYNSILVYEKPEADFISLSGTTICGNTPILFADNSKGVVTNWFWDFGDGEYDYNYNPSYQYFDTGTYTVTMVAINGTCKDTAVKENYIKVLPPFPHISGVMNTCNDTRGLVTISQDSRQATGWEWDFGDGSSPVTLTTKQSSISHTYTTTGSYKVVLTATAGGCSVRDSVTAYVLLKQKPLLTVAQSTICSSDLLNITISNFEQNPYNKYYYTPYYYIDKVLYGDSSDFTGTISSQVFDLTSIQAVLQNFDNQKKDLKVITYSDYFNCRDTTNLIPLKIKGPIAGYSISKNNVCYKSPVIFDDSSRSQNNVPLKTWQWTFGDNTTETLTSGSDVYHVYPDPGTYYAQLTVTDADGCSSTVSNYSNQPVVNGPKAAFSPSPQTVMPNSNVYFYNYTNNYGAYNPIYSWLFGDGTSSTDPFPNHSYSTTGTDTVKLFAQDKTTGCADTTTQIVYVKNVLTSFTFTTSYINNNSCPPLLAQFQNTSQNANTVSWDFGDGNVADNQNFPSHTYYNPGVYRVTLYGYGNNNAVDSTVDSITVKGPYASLSADVLNGCRTAMVTLNAKASGATSFTWDFADGTVESTNDTFGVHTYTTPGTYIPALIMKDGSGCSSTFSLKDTIVIDSLNIEGINQLPAVVCDSGFTTFEPTIKSIAADDMHRPLQYHWTFDEANPGDTSDMRQPAHYYDQLGTHTVLLKVISPFGCVEEFRDTVWVEEKAKGAIAGPTVICQNSAADFTGSSTLPNVTWNWDFGNGNTSTAQVPASQKFEQPKDSYQIRLIVNHAGCDDTSFTMLRVDPIPDINILPVEPRICLGNSIQLIAHDAVSYKWNPNVNIDNANSASPIVNPSTTTTYWVKAVNEFSCENTDSVTVAVVQPFDVILAPVSFACEGIGVQLDADGADIYKWISGTGLSRIDIPNPHVNPDTTTVYTVVGYDAYGCFTDTAATTVEIKPLPTVDAGPDITLLAGSTVTLQPAGSNDVIAWNWTPATYLNCADCRNPESSPRSDITYTVTATNTYNCSIKDSVNIKLVCTESIVKIPSSFTPNHDGLNDWFCVLGRGIKMVKHITIFNRMGQLLYERNNILPNDHSAGWDGRFGGLDMPSGTYVYFATIICDTGDEFTYKGTVVLIR